jgi:hypothetical protein
MSEPLGGRPARAYEVMRVSGDRNTSLILTTRALAAWGLQDGGMGIFLNNVALRSR